MRDVGDDRAAEREAIFLARLVRLALAGRDFVGPRRTQMLVGVGTEGFALEAVGARLRLGDDDRARRIAIFGGVVGADDLIFGDRELRERVAGSPLPSAPPLPVKPDPLPWVPPPLPTKSFWLTPSM